MSTCRLFVGLVVAVLLAGTARGEWVTLTANPDLFPSGTDITNAFPGIKLETGFFDDYNVHMGPVFAYHIPGTPEGDNVFAASADGDKFYGVSNWNRNVHWMLSVTLSEPTDYLSLTAVQAGDRSKLWATSFPKGTQALYKSGFPTVEIVRVNRDIHDIRFWPVSLDDWARADGYLDNLQYNAIPEPSSFALLGVGCFALLAYGWRRERRRRR